MSFRFEKNENAIVKHHLGKKVHWTQAAFYAFTNDLAKTTVVSVKQLNADTVEIMKRRDFKLGFFYRYFGTDQKALYERVTINRKDKSVAIDRMDGNWWYDAPFVGRRDFFYIENREGNNSHNGDLTFVRHDYWVFKLDVPMNQLISNYSQWSYRKAF